MPSQPDTSIVKATKLDWNMILSDWSPIPEALSFTPSYQRTRGLYGVDIVQLTMLTNFMVASNAQFSSQQLSAVMNEPKQQQSFLEFVPALYDYSPCVAAATDCVLALASTLLAPSPSDNEKQLRLYGKALSVLQDAIGRTPPERSAELLCAIQLLSLRDLMNKSDETAWASHVQGCALIVKRRKPSGFKNDFEKALFTAHAGDAIIHAFKSHTSCYLERPEWQQLYHSTKSESPVLTRHSPLAIRARTLLFSCPRLIYDINNFMTSGDIYTAEEEAMGALRAREQELHDSAVSWMKDYAAYSIATSLSTPSPAELLLRRELFGSTLGTLCIAKRLLACLSVTERPQLEKEVQGLARQYSNMCNSRAETHTWIFSSHETKMSQGLMLTTEQFQDDLALLPKAEQRERMKESYFALKGMLVQVFGLPVTMKGVETCIYGYNKDADPMEMLGSYSDDPL